MKRILILLSVFLVFFTHAQNLTMSHIEQLSKMDFSDAEEFLISKGWEFCGAEEETETTVGNVSFTYNKSDISDTAESFLTYLYSPYSPGNRVAFK